MMRKTYTPKPRKCPACGSKRIAEILYGLPLFSEELKHKIEEGEVILGGCCVSADDPCWQCADCGNKFYKT